MPTNHCPPAGHCPATLGGRRPATSWSSRAGDNRVHRESVCRPTIFSTSSSGTLCTWSVTFPPTPLLRTILFPRLPLQLGHDPLNLHVPHREGHQIGVGAVGAIRPPTHRSQNQHRQKNPGKLHNRTLPSLFSPRKPGPLGSPPRSQHPSGRAAQVHACGCRNPHLVQNALILNSICEKLQGMAGRSRLPWRPRLSRPDLS